MNAELRKRIEEAADNYVKSIKDGMTVEVDKSSREEAVLTLCLELCYSAFIAGAELGYKEAIAQAKEWLDENVRNYSSTVIGRKAMVADFESEMNKLLEGKK